MPEHRWTWRQSLTSNPNLILEQNSVTWGLVQAPDQTIHRVLENNYAGENYGQITRITEDRISILEIVPDGLGAWVEREASLALGEE